jgi:hypothetical protein
MPLFFGISLQIQGQGVTTSVSTNIYMEAYNIRGRAFENKDAVAYDGSPLMNDNWGKGSVTFKDGKMVKEIDLKFNLEKNELYFNRDGGMFLFNDPVSAFQITYGLGSRTIFSTFKSGYPVNGRLGEQVFYEVIYEGPRYHMLTFRYSYLGDANRYGGGVKQAFVTGEELYVYETGVKMMHRVKRQESSIKEALPKVQDKINQICSENKLKLKNNEELIKLFSILNQ